MNVAIASSALAAITGHAAAAHPHEACGVLLGGADRITAAVPAANLAADPARAFDIDPAVLFATHRAARGGGDAVVGCYHSHPDGVLHPSSRDAAGAVEAGRLWLIAAAGRIAAWRVVAGGAEHGRFDPVTLIAV